MADLNLKCILYFIIESLIYYTEEKHLTSDMYSYI